MMVRSLLIYLIYNIEGMEIQVAGSEAERNEMMPLLYAKTSRDKANVEVIITILYSRINIE
jgi:hypothetical protein